MQIILSEEEFNKLKRDEKSLYDQAYKDAHDKIWETEVAFLKELSQLLESEYGWCLNQESKKWMAIKIEALQKKHLNIKSC